MKRREEGYKHTIYWEKPIKLCDSSNSLQFYSAKK